MPILWDNIRNLSSTHTFQSALLGAVQREVLKTSGSHAEILRANHQSILIIWPDPFFSGPNVKEKKAVWAARLVDDGTVVNRTSILRTVRTYHTRMVCFLYHTRMVVPYKYICFAQYKTFYRDWRLYTKGLLLFTRLSKTFEFVIALHNYINRTTLTL